MKRTAFRLALVLLVFTGAAAAAVSATAAASGTAKWTTTLVGGDPFALDCPTTTFCLAGFNTEGTDEAVTFNGHRWSNPSVIFKYDGELEAVGCLGADDCVAISGGGESRTLRGGKWSAPRSVAAIDGYPFPGHAYALSCVPTGCDLVDDAGRAAWFDGRTWSALRSVDDAPFTAVSCVSANWCAASDGGGRVVFMRDRQWGRPATVDDSGISSLSCASTTACVAVDLMGRWLRFDGSTWTPPARLASVTALPMNVACVAGGHCLAVGMDGVTHRLANHRWSVAKGVVVPSDGLGGGGLVGVSCAGRTSTLCTFISAFGFAATSADPFS